jgi:hypothetical protein
MRERLGEPEDGLRLARGLDRSDERLRRPACCCPVRRELGRGRGRLAARELVGEPGVQLLTLAGKQRRVDRLRQQRVAEAEAAPRLVGDEDAVLDGRAQRLAHVALGQRRRGAQQRVADVAPRGRRQPQHALRRAIEPRHPLQQHDTQAVRQLAALVARRGQELLGVERIAFGAGEDLVGQRPRRCAGARSEQRRQLLALERPQLDQERRARALDAVGEPAHALRRRGLVLAVGGHQQHAPIVEVVREVDDEVERRRVGPVQVLEHQQHRRVRRAVREEGKRVLEDKQLGAGRFAFAAPISKRAQRLDERLVWQLGADEIEAAPEERLEALGTSACRELRRQSGLADARLAGDERRRPVPAARRVQRLLEPAELVHASDERLARACLHGAQYPPGTDRAAER